MLYDIKKRKKSTLSPFTVLSFPEFLYLYPFYYYISFIFAKLTVVESDVLASRFNPYITG